MTSLSEISSCEMKNNKKRQQTSNLQFKKKFSYKILNLESFNFLQKMFSCCLFSENGLRNFWAFSNNFEEKILISLLGKFWSQKYFFQCFWENFAKTIFRLKLE